MTREPDKFQIQLANTVDPYSTCGKCSKVILSKDDPEHVIVWPVAPALPVKFHTICFGDALEGMVQFFKVFIVEKRKKVKDASLN